MNKSRQELRSIVSRIDAAISILRVRHSSDMKFFQSTDGIFSSAFNDAHHEDDDWLAVLVDEVCTRQGMPYPMT